MQRAQGVEMGVHLRHVFKLNIFLCMPQALADG